MIFSWQYLLRKLNMINGNLKSNKIKLITKQHRQRRMSDEEKTGELFENLYNVCLANCNFSIFASINDHLKSTVLNWFHSSICNTFVKIKNKIVFRALLKQIMKYHMIQLLALCSIIYNNDIVDCLWFSNLSLFVEDSMLYINNNNGMKSVINKDLRNMNTSLCNSKYLL